MRNREGDHGVKLAKSDLQVRFREPEEKDIEAMASLEELCFGDSFSEKTIREMICQEEYTLMAAFDLDDPDFIMGYAGYRKALDEGDIIRVSVLPECRNRGLGQTLMKILARQAAEEGIREIYLEVRASNIPAIRIYEITGFQKIGVRKDYYRQPKEDAIIMSLKLFKEEN